MMTKLTFKQFSAMAKAEGLEAKEFPKFHWQVMGAGLTVNYWPRSKNQKVYISGTTEASLTYASPKDVFAAAKRPPIVERKVPRKASYKRHRLRMLRVRPLCHWCNMRLDEKTATIEHVIPLSRGGLNNANNLKLACEPCNKKRGNSMPELKG